MSLSVLQDLNKDPVKEMAAELEAEEANPTQPEPSFKEQNKAVINAEFDAETQKEEAAAEAEPETAETKEEAPEAVEEEGRTVPLKALSEARRKAAMWEEKAREYERYVAEQQGYQRALQEQNNQQAPQEEPDPETDPIGALRWEREQRHQLQQRLEQESAYREQQIALEGFKQQYATDMRSFVAQKPEAKDAYTHVFNNRVNELVALGVNPAQANMQVQQEEINLVSNAYQRGQHPGEVIMAIAKSRGFTAKPAVAPPTVEQKLESAKARTTAAVGVAKGGNVPKSDVKPEDLIHLEGAAFDKAWDKLAAQSKKPLRFR
jgi:hypothetical protein